eukprot:8951281-Karenia_brevis.AAC.1
MVEALSKNDHMCTHGAHNENARSQGLFGLDICMEILMQHHCRAGVAKPTHKDYSCTAGGALEDARRAVSAYSTGGVPTGNSCTAG